jgi:hypothetical protein
MQITLLDSILVEIFQDIRMHTIGMLQGFQKYRNDNRKVTTNKLETPHCWGSEGYLVTCDLFTQTFIYLCKKKNRYILIQKSGN